LSSYTVYVSPQAYRDIDEIYEYIRTELFAEDAAIRLVEDIEEAILSLEEMPERGVERKVGAYAYKGYRQLFLNAPST
jgi:plasmid stabilization system protein ParE